MNWSVKIAKSLTTSRFYNKHRYIKNLSIIVMALCVMTVLLSSMYINGFEKNIRNKVFKYWSHIRIQPISNSNNTYLNPPLEFSSNDFESIKSNLEINKIIPVANKGVILKNKENIEGVILKGIVNYTESAYYGFSKKQNLSHSENQIPIILSEIMMDRMDIEIGDKLLIHIIDSSIQNKVGKVVNSYNTNIEDFDHHNVFADIQNIKKLNNWNKSEYSWIEVNLKNSDDIISETNKLYNKMSDQIDVVNIYHIFPQMFDWLELMKKNESIILIVMLIVAIVNILSTVSISILEKTKVFGTLKILGAKNKSLYKMLLYGIYKNIFTGIIIGNFVAILIGLIQKYFKIIKLDPSIYYVNHAPIDFNIPDLIKINIIILIVSLLAALIPIKSISKISPIKVAEYQ